MTKNQTRSFKQKQPQTEWGMFDKMVTKAKGQSSPSTGFPLTPYRFYTSKVDTPIKEYKNDPR